MRLLLLFVVVPAVELALLIEIGSVIGTANTFAIIVATGIAGSWLARTQGLSVWRRFQERLASGAMPGNELVDGLIVLISGALLLTPGVLTDVVGLLGLIPPSRHVIRNVVVHQLKDRIHDRID